MAAVVASIAAEDMVFARPYLTGARRNQPPTVDEYLAFNKQTQKTKAAKAFRESLAVCAANSEAMPKLLTILASSLRDCLTSWVTFGVGLELFSINGIQDIVLARCDTHFIRFFQDMLAFNDRVMEGIPPRFFDLRFQEALAEIQLRNDDSLEQLFWPEKRIACTTAPGGRMRNSSFLPYIDDAAYNSVYQRLGRSENMDFTLLSKKEFTNYFKWNVPAVRYIVPQVALWLISAVEKSVVKTRYGQEPAYDQILNEEYFSRMNVRDPPTVALNFVNLLVRTVYDYRRDFDPKDVPGIDLYLRVQSEGGEGKTTAVGDDL